MLRLSRLTVVLLVGAALLSAVSEWDRLTEGNDASPLYCVGSWFVPRLTEDRQDLDVRMGALVARSQQMDHLAGEVAAGRMALLDGAARLRDVCRAAPDFPWERFREGYRGDSDDERFCRMLIGRVVGVLWNDQDHALAVGARLEAELDVYLKRGTFRLPQ